MAELPNSLVLSMVSGVSQEQTAASDHTQVSTQPDLRLVQHVQHIAPTDSRAKEQSNLLPRSSS